MKRMACMGTMILLLGVLALTRGQPAAADPVNVPCFSQTGYCLDNAAIADYFAKRGGVNTFGYPTSRTFVFGGFATQFFQRRIVQVGPDGSARLLNILDPGLMPYTSFNGASFPAIDAQLVASAPAPTDQAAVLAFVKQYAPDTWQGVPVNFYQTFSNTVSCAVAFPGGNCQPGLLPGFDLEMWGLPTSLAAADPNNSNFVYQRFQRGIMMYDATCACTHGVLLGDYFKSILTGQNLPADLAAEAADSPLLNQYNPANPNANASVFAPDMPGYVPTGPTATPAPTWTPATGTTPASTTTPAPTVTAAATATPPATATPSLTATGVPPTPAPPSTTPYPYPSPLPPSGAAAYTVTTLVSGGLSSPGGIAVDGGGNLYVADYGDNAVKEWTRGGSALTTLISNGPSSAPWGVAVDSSGNVYDEEEGNSTRSNGAINEWVKASDSVHLVIWPGAPSPGGVAVDSSGNIYFDEFTSNTIMKYILYGPLPPPPGPLTILVSSGLSSPRGVAVDSNDNVYIADAGDNAIKKWAPSTKALTTLVSAGLNGPTGVAVDSRGDVYIADTGDNAIKEWVPSTGSLVTLVSTGLNRPQGVAVDSAGNAYISDTGDNAIKEASPG